MKEDKIIQENHILRVPVFVYLYVYIYTYMFIYLLNTYATLSY